MTPTNEQIFAEAIRRQKERGGGAVTDFIIEVVREGWTPPEPVDPDVLAFREWETRVGCSDAYRKAVLEGKWDHSVNARAYRAGACMARAEKLSLLNWLSDQKSLEVSWGGDPEGNGAWSVYRVTGGLNDREWHLIATGETPLAALKNARALLKEPDQ